MPNHRLHQIETNHLWPDFHATFLIKRNEFLQQPVHLIEIDLLIGGHRLTHQQPLPDAEYYAFVTRAESSSKCHVTAWSGDGDLPQISIPLLAPDQDVFSSLQIVFEVAYQKGRYSR